MGKGKVKNIIVVSTNERNRPLTMDQSQNNTIRTPNPSVKGSLQCLA